MAEEKKNPLIGAFRSPPPKEAAKAPPDAKVAESVKPSTADKPIPAAQKPAEPVKPVIPPKAEETKAAPKPNGTATPVKPTEEYLAHPAARGAEAGQVSGTVPVSADKPYRDAAAAHHAAGRTASGDGRAHRAAAAAVSGAAQRWDGTGCGHRGVYGQAAGITERMETVLLHRDGRTAHRAAAYRTAGTGNFGKRRSGTWMQAAKPLT